MEIHEKIALSLRQQMLYFFRSTYTFALMPRKSKLLDSWLEHPLYSVWIGLGKVDTLVRFKSCCKDICIGVRINISNIGESTLKSHMK